MSSVHWAGYACTVVERERDVPPAGSPDQIRSIIQWRDDRRQPPEVLLLQEVNPNQRARWRERLADRLGYQGVVDTLDQAEALVNSNGHLTAVRDGDISPNKFDEVQASKPAGDALAFPEKILVSDIERADGTIEVWNVRAVSGGSYPEEKVKLLETIYRAIEARGERPRLLAGDLNTLQEELPDGQPVTYGYRRAPDEQSRAVATELQLLNGLGHFGLLDTFRTRHGYGPPDQLDISHDGRRIDHLFAHQSYTPIECQYHDVPTELSDHNPITAILEPVTHPNRSHTENRTE